MTIRRLTAPLATQLCVLSLVLQWAVAQESTEQEKTLARPDVEFPIFQFPADRIPRIDGDPADWDFVPEIYRIRTDQLRDTVMGNEDRHDPADLDVSVTVGWVNGQNHLYFLYEARDDYWDFDRRDLHNDIFEIVVDGDLSGGPLISPMHPNEALRENPETWFQFQGVHAQNYHILTPAKDKDWAMVWGPQPWIRELPFANAVCKYSFQPKESGRLVLEFFITPFDHAPPDRSLAVPTQLIEDNILALSWAILDYDDETAERYDGFWNLSHKTTMYGDASDLVAFRLMPLETGVGPAMDCDWSFTVLNASERRVAYHDQSRGNVTSWHWDFGDGHTSDEQHPVHRYEKAGQFIVTLKVEGPDGTARKTKIWDVTLP